MSSEDSAPPPPQGGARPSTAYAEGAASSSAEDVAPHGGEGQNFIPSEERVVLPEDDERDPTRIRPRTGPRVGPVQSVLSEMLSQSSSRRSSKYRRSMSGIPNLQETLKEKQARFREAREGRKLKIESSYKYIFEILAECLNLDVVTVEELILDCPSGGGSHLWSQDQQHQHQLELVRNANSQPNNPVFKSPLHDSDAHYRLRTTVLGGVALLDLGYFLQLEAFGHFFVKDGCKTLKFLYQEGDAPGVECGRTIAGVTKGAKMMRLYIDSAAPEKLKGVCVFFVRCRNDVAINMKNIHEEVLFTILDATEGLLNGIRSMLSNVFLPAILSTSNWGALNQSKRGESDKHVFTETINRYLSFLDGMCYHSQVKVTKKEAKKINKIKPMNVESTSTLAKPRFG